MTICVAVKVHDCLVFAADSALSLVEGGETVNVYSHGNKVFNLIFKGLPVCAMFCGMGNIGRSSISSLAKELEAQLTVSPDAGGLKREWIYDRGDRRVSARTHFRADICKASRAASRGPLTGVFCRRIFCWFGHR